jgi:hypothetical protein
VRQFAAIWLLATLCGCAAPVQHGTASGKPEVTISNTTQDIVKPLVVNRMLSAGYRITRDTQFELAFDAPVQNVAAQVLLGSKYDSQPNARVSYSFASTGTGLRVVADIAIITNPGSGFERRTEMNQSADSPLIQNMLDAVRSEVEMAGYKGPTLGLAVLPIASARAAGFTTSAARGLYITTINTGSVAEKVGLTKGDVILTYNGKPTNSLSDLGAEVRATKPGGTAKVEVLRDGTEHSVNVKFDDPTRASRSGKT